MTTLSAHTVKSVYVAERGKAPRFLKPQQITTFVRKYGSAVGELRGNRWNSADVVGKAIAIVATVEVQ